MTDASLPDELLPSAAPERRDDIAPVAPSSGSFQFSLRTLFILLTLSAIGLGWFYGGPERQRRVVKEIEERGAAVWYAGDERYINRPPDTGWIPQDYYRSVEGVDVLPSLDHDGLLECVARLPSVKEIYLESAQVSERGMLAITSQTSIERFITEPTSSIDQSLLRHLVRLPRLRVVVLQGKHFTDASTPSLAELPRLEVLAIDNTDITDEGLSHLRGLDRLTELLLPSSITDAGLLHLADLKGLKKLDLSGATHIEGPGLAHLSALQSLERIELSSTTIDDQAIPQLLKLRSLTSINLSYTRVTMPGVRSLLDLPKLAGVGTVGLYLPPDELKKFREALEKRRGGPVEPSAE